MRVSRLFSIRRETKMPWRQTPSRKKKAVVFTNVTTNAYQGQLNAGFSKVWEIFKVRGIESLKKHPRVSHTLTQGCVFFGDLRSDLNANSASLWPSWHGRVYAFCVQGIISKIALRWRRGDVTVPNCWIKSLFLFYFRTKSILVAS